MSRKIRMSRWMGKYLYICAAVFFLSVFGAIPASSAQSGRGVEIRRLSPARFPAFSDDLDYERLDSALSGTINWLKKLPPGKKIKIGPDRYASSVLASGFERFSAFIATRPDSRAVAKYIAAHGRVYAVLDRESVV